MKNFIFFLLAVISILHFVKCNEEEKITLSETEDGIRELYYRDPKIGSILKQSMNISDPTELTDDSARMFMAHNMIHHKPYKVLNFGTKSGSLVNFFLKMYPNSTVLTVELNNEIIKATQEFFSLSLKSGRKESLFSSLDKKIEEDEKILEDIESRHTIIQGDFNSTLDIIKQQLRSENNNNEESKYDMIWMDLYEKMHQRDIMKDGKLTHYYVPLEEGEFTNQDGTSKRSINDLVNHLSADGMVLIRFFSASKKKIESVARNYLSVFKKGFKNTLTEVKHSVLAFGNSQFVSCSSFGKAYETLKTQGKISFTKEKLQIVKI